MKRKWFRKSWQIFLKYGPGLLIAGFIFWGFVILYNKDNWVALSALTTLILALAAFWAIWQNYSLHKRERKERLLNEIIEWAKKVYSMPWKFGSIFKEAVKVTNKNDAYLFKIAHIEDIKESFIEFHGNNLYAKEISLCFTDLHNASLKLISEYEKYTELLDQYGTVVRKVKKNEATQVDEQEAESKVDASSRQINNYAYKVIKEATKIKTRDIGKEEENMSGEGEVTGSNELTIKDIEKHLCQQDKRLKDGTYFSAYLFGAALIFIAFSLLAGKYILTTEFWYVTYCIVILIGGTGLSLFAWYKRSKPPK